MTVAINTPHSIYLKTYESLARKTDFALVVQDNSMSPSIKKNSIVLVEVQTKFNKQGEILILKTNEGKTLIRSVYKRKSNYTLMPHNTTYKVLKIKCKNIKLIGKVISII